MIASLVREIADEANTEAVCQMACIVMKNLISRSQNVSIVLQTQTLCFNITNH